MGVGLSAFEVKWCNGAGGWGGRLMRGFVVMRAGKPITIGCATKAEAERRRRNIMALYRRWGWLTEEEEMVGMPSWFEHQSADGKTSTVKVTVPASLWSYACDCTGSGYRWQELADANPGKDPKWTAQTELPVGEELKVPRSWGIGAPPPPPPLEVPPMDEPAAEPATAAQRG